MARRTIAGLGALSALAVRTESLLSRPADVSTATPHHLPLPAGGGRPWQDWEEPLMGWRGGGDSVFSARGGQAGVGSGRFGPAVGAEGVLLNIIWCPASCRRDYYLLARSY